MKKVSANAIGRRTLRTRIANLEQQQVRSEARLVEFELWSKRIGASFEVMQDLLGSRFDVVSTQEDWRISIEQKLIVLAGLVYRAAMGRRQKAKKKPGKPSGGRKVYGPKGD